MTWQLMSTVQIEMFEPSGIASRCSWVIGCRRGSWKHYPLKVAWGDFDTAMPSTVFVTSGLIALFYKKILPCIDNATRFVLLIGDEDITTPNQMDGRWKSPIIARRDWDSMLADRRILHFYIEHLDERFSARVSPLPIGLNPEETIGNNPDTWLGRIAQAPIDVRSRPLRVLSCDRVRDGLGVWSTRARVKSYCESNWTAFCDLRVDIARADFLAEISKYPFIACVRGGGIDPNPKLWSALLAGVIPIIETFPGDSMYASLPVMIIDSWRPEALTPEFLARERRRLAPHFEDKRLRAAVIRQLMADFWWEKVMSHFSPESMIQ
jgi:hypothetical protein